MGKRGERGEYQAGCSDVDERAHDCLGVGRGRVGRRGGIYTKWDPAARRWISEGHGWGE